MRTPVPDYLDDLIVDCADNSEGEPADYIPELARADVDRFAVAVALPDGTVYRSGDSESRFTIQSISKPFVYALALQSIGLDAVLSKVGTEPSGDAFNEISLEEGTGRPRNPMINVGAITTHGLVGGTSASAADRFEQIRSGLSAFVGRDLEVDENVFDSELKTADRNRSLAFMVRSYGVIEGDPLELVREYTRQCSLLVSSADLAIMGSTLANGGLNPRTNERVVDSRVARQVLSVMMTCGMYDAAGDWMSAVGIPAKSGVSGGVMGVLPGEVGIASFSPRLDRFGNSVRGVRLFQRLSDDMGLHLMNTPPRGPVAVRDVVEQDLNGTRATVILLQGAIHFSEAEQALRVLSSLETGDRPVALDLSRVSEFNNVGRRMILEGVRRLSLDGHPITVVDPDGVLPDPDPGDGAEHPTVVRSL